MCKTCRYCHKPVGPADRQATNQVDLCVGCYKERREQQPAVKKK